MGPALLLLLLSAPLCASREHLGADILTALNLEKTATPCYSAFEETFKPLIGRWKKTEHPPTFVREASIWSAKKRCPLLWNEQSCDGRHLNTKKVFAPDGCSLTPLSGDQGILTPLLEQLSGQKLVFFGNSLLRQLYISMACTLLHVEEGEEVEDCTSWCTNATLDDWCERAKGDILTGQYSRFLVSKLHFKTRNIKLEYHDPRSAEFDKKLFSRDLHFLKEQLEDANDCGVLKAHKEALEKLKETSLFNKYPKTKKMVKATVETMLAAAEEGDVSGVKTALEKIVSKCQVSEQVCEHGGEIPSKDTKGDDWHLKAFLEHYGDPPGGASENTDKPFVIYMPEVANFKFALEFLEKHKDQYQWLAQRSLGVVSFPSHWKNAKYVKGMEGCHPSKKDYPPKMIKNCEAYGNLSLPMLCISPLVVDNHKEHISKNDCLHWCQSSPSMSLATVAAFNALNAIVTEFTSGAFAGSFQQKIFPHLDTTQLTLPSFYGFQDP